MVRMTRVFGPVSIRIPTCSNDIACIDAPAGMRLAVEVLQQSLLLFEFTEPQPRISKHSVLMGVASMASGHTGPDYNLLDSRPRLGRLTLSEILRR